MPAWLPPSPLRASNTWLVDYTPIIEQGLVDLARWVEEGVAPASTSYEYVDGQVRLPATAAERGGVQPVVSVTANGGAMRQVAVGEPVTLSVQAEAPAAGGHDRRPCSGTSTARAPSRTATRRSTGPPRR